MDNSLSLSVKGSEKLITTKELAQSLGVTSRTIQQVVEKLGLANSISQVKIRGQNSFAFTKEQATAIKIELQNHSKIAKNGFNTLDVSNEIEGELLVQRAMAYQQQKIDLLQKQVENQKIAIEELTPDAESWRKFAESDGSFSAPNVAKMIGAKRDEVIQFLNVKGYIMREQTKNPKKLGKWIGTAMGIDHGYIKNYLFTNEKTSQIQFHLTPKGMQKVEKAFKEIEIKKAEQKRIDRLCAEAERTMKPFSCGKAE